MINFNIGPVGPDHHLRAQSVRMSVIINCIYTCSKRSNPKESGV
jgi:hypothetical protein